MRKSVALNLAGTVAVSLLLLAGWVDPVLAETKCQTSEGTCFDTRTKEYRKCTTKVCTDETGKVLSTETEIYMEGGSRTSKPKVTVPKAPATGGVKQ
jgi:hypothetical protein